MENKGIKKKKTAVSNKKNFNELSESELDKIIRLTLIRIGIKCDHMGFGYLIESIKVAVEEPELIHDLKKLFTIVAEKCNAPGFFRVEANIHNAISFTYKNRGFDYINQIYGMEVIKPEIKPSTAEVIRLVAEYFLLGLYKKDFN